MFLAGKGFWVLLGWKFLTLETKTEVWGVGDSKQQMLVMRSKGEAQLETLVVFLLKKPTHSLCLCKSDLR